MDASNLAYIYTALGDTESAMRHLEKAVTQHNGDMLGIKVDPRLKPLRREAHFQDLVRHIGLSA